jgi:exosome complex RNA-binding protein Rrp4
MEILLEIYMYIKSEIKKYLMVRKVRKKFNELSNIDKNIKKLYEDNQRFFETDDKVAAKVLEVDKNNNCAIEELVQLLRKYSEQSQ